MSDAKKKCLLPKEYLQTINNTRTDWQPFTMTSVAIELNEQDKLDEVSALPTPWARMQFVNMVFSKWGGSADHEAQMTLEEKHIVNHTFDLLELIFYSNFYAIDLQFRSINDFKAGNYFGKATSTFFRFPKPTLIKAKLNGSAGAAALLGSTSPYTLVYPVMHLIKESYPMGKGRRLFDKNVSGITPLNKRPKMFASFLALMVSKLSEDNTHPTQSFKTAIGTWISSSEVLDINLTGEAVRVSFSADEHLPIYKLKEEVSLQSPYFYAGNVIVIGEHHREGVNYLTGFPLVLDTSYEALAGEPNKTVLPGTIIKQKWVHESGFFSPKLVRMPYELNGDSFYIGKTENTDNKLYAPPLTPAYYTNPAHWNGNELLSETSLSIKNVHAKTKAEVEILLLNNQMIKVSRTYESDQLSKSLEEAAFALKIFPNYYLGNYDDHKAAIGALPYFVSLYDDAGIASYPVLTSLKFYGIDGLPIEPDSSRDRKKKTNVNDENAVINYQLSKLPRRVEMTVKMGAEKELFIFSFLPKFVKKQYKYVESSGIAIGFDFGTTNSTIAYKYLGINEEPIIAEFSKLKECTTYYPGVKMPAGEKYENEFERFFIEPGSYKKIFRSVINYSSGVNKFKDWITFNVFFDKVSKPDEFPDNEVRPEFKWDINKRQYSGQATNWVTHYISSNLLLLKYLLLQEGRNIDLNNMKLVWFFPLAFDEVQRDQIREIWSSQEVFPALKEEVRELDESIAPFTNSPYYSATNSTKALNVDVGGGTTDICMLQGTKVLLKLSLPVAGRNILGDMYSKSDAPLMHNPLPWSNVSPIQGVVGKPRSSHEHFINQPEEAKKEILIRASPVVIFFAYCILKYVKIAIDVNRKGQSDGVNDYPDTIRFSGNGAKIFASILANENGISYVESLDKRNHSFNDLIALIFGKRISVEFSANLKEDTVIGGIKSILNGYAGGSKGMSNDEYEIVGENVNTIGFDDTLKVVQKAGANIRISPNTGSYLLNTFAREFLDLLIREEKLFEQLFRKDGVEKRTELIKYLQQLVDANDLVKLQNYISGGIESSGVSLEKIKSSLLMFELQGVILEMARAIVKER